MLTNVLKNAKKKNKVFIRFLSQTVKLGSNLSKLYKNFENCSTFLEID